jgi:hypothetical protein
MDPDKKAPELFATVELMQGARKAFTSPPVRVDKLGTGRPNMAAFNFQVPLARLAPGEYVSQVDVFDNLGQKFAFPRNSLVVVP